MRSGKQIHRRWLAIVLSGGLVGYGVVALLSFQRRDRALDMTRVGQVLEDRGNFQGAIQKYKAAVAIDPKFPYGLMLLGRAYHESGNDGKALEEYQRALVLSPRHFWVHYLVGELYKGQARYTDAIKKFTELVTMPDNWAHSNKILGYTQYQRFAYIELGYCYAKIGDKPRAIQAYERYLTLIPPTENASNVKQLVGHLKGEQ